MEGNNNEGDEQGTGPHGDRIGQDDGHDALSLNDLCPVCLEAEVEPRVLQCGYSAA